MASTTCAAFQQRAKGLQGEFTQRAARYDGLVVKHRKTATTIETIVAIGLVLLGTSSVAGGFASIAAAIDTADDSGVNAWEVIYAFLVPLVGLTVAVLGAYLKVCDPRGKQQLFGSASDACGAVAGVAQIVADTRLRDPASTEMSNLVNGMLTTLETSASDNQPPLAPLPSKKRR